MTDVLMRIVLEEKRFRKFQHDFVQSTESHSIDDLLFVPVFEREARVRFS